MSKAFSPGFNIQPLHQPLGFALGDDCFGPQTELRTLDSIRKSLMEPDVADPEIVYAIMMDVGKKIHRELLNQLHLLYGVVTYAAGTLGKEPVRSQGHIHVRSTFANGYSTPEVYEIWQGKAIIYMQELGGDNPGKCIAVYGNSGDVIIVPPGWVHATISAQPDSPLTFGAWCDRNYGFDYDEVRAHKGIAWFPIVVDGEIQWIRNENYQKSELQLTEARTYPEFSLEKGKPIYTQFEENKDKFLFVTRPDLFKDIWK
ncbi:MAG: Glucose-6-phosphate isomerase [Candidatus Ordinivivax streblomastigis]|uniref:glucose-6-phosphate isomerase n=1 Tax=Candidatus Ordinivivax streblomastigis TaxID=2540710 RepID=A0A5M8NXZ9_9BACT|nr:MAG: Glucose-6-phosphate isomerase [Candidatus Ordinivivax streblomastigis]